MPERYGFRFTGGERLAALRPTLTALAVFLLVGGVVLGLSERHNAAQHARSAADRAGLDSRVTRNSEAIDRLRATTERAIEGHAEIKRKLDAILARLPAPGAAP